MRVQDSAFRLPALKLQPREYKFNFSQESIDQNLSKEAIKQSSPLNHYNPSPIRNRNKVMSVSVYNSQEKQKQSNETKYLQNSDFITCQNTNNSISVVQTVRRYRSKLKKMVQHNYHKNEINSRDPRYFFFKEPSATIRLANLQENSKQVDKILEERIKQLMTKIQILLSTQSFYQAQKSENKIKVNMVKLQDEYDVLYQDFNEFYFSKKHIDAQVRNLLNHMQIIKSLLSPLSKPFHKYVKSSQSLHQNMYDLILEDPKESASQRVIAGIGAEILISEQDGYDGENDQEFDEDGQNSLSIENNSPTKKHNKPGRTLTNGRKGMKSNSKGNVTKQGTLDSQLNEDNMESNSNSESSDDEQELKGTQKMKKKSGQQVETKEGEQENSLQEQDSLQPNVLNQNKKQQHNTSKKRQTISSLGADGYGNEGMAYDEEGNIVIQEEEASQDEQNSEGGQKSPKKKKHKELELNWNQTEHYQQHQQEQEQQIQNRINRSEIKQFQEGEDEEITTYQSYLIIQHPNHELNCYQLLDRFISLENIYDYKYLQSWNTHIQKIKQAKFFDEFDI